MSAIGMNVSADGRHTLGSLRALNCTWARIVFRREFDIGARLMEYATGGISVLLVFDRTSIEAYDSPDAAFVDAERRYDPFVDAWQIANEPDGEGPSSWTMSQEDFTALGRIARDRLPGRLIVAGGMVSGQPDWLVGQDLSWCDAIGVHPYLKDFTPGNDLPDVDVMIRQYMALGKPIIVSEWGWWGTDEKRGKAEIDDMIGWAAKTNLIPLFFYFCADDAMVTPFGLYRVDGTPKPAVSAFTAQARNAVAVPLPIPTPAPTPDPAPEPEPVLAPLDQAYAALWNAISDTITLNPESAFYKRWRENHRDWGSPITNEITDDDGSVIQTFAVAGPMRWREGDAVEAA